MKKRNEKGFSLIDVLIAAIIVGVGLVGVMRALPIALKTYIGNERQVYSSLLYYSAASHLKTLGFLAVGSTGSYNFKTDLGVNGSDEWNYSYTIENLSDPTASDLVRVARIQISNSTGYSDTFTTLILNDKFSP